MLLNRSEHMLFKIPWPVNIFLIYKLRVRLSVLGHMCCGWSITGQGPLVQFRAALTHHKMLCFCCHPTSACVLSMQKNEGTEALFSQLCLGMKEPKLVKTL